MFIQNKDNSVRKQNVSNKIINYFLKMNILILR